MKHVDQNADHLEPTLQTDYPGVEVRAFISIMGAAHRHRPIFPSFHQENTCEATCATICLIMDATVVKRKDDFAVYVEQVALAPTAFFVYLVASNTTYLFA